LSSAWYTIEHEGSKAVVVSRGEIAYENVVEVVLVMVEVTIDPRETARVVE
jgi:hypothetical protein